LGPAFLLLPSRWFSDQPVSLCTIDISFSRSCSLRVRNTAKSDPWLHSNIFPLFFLDLSLSTGLRFLLGTAMIHLGSRRISTPGAAASRHNNFSSIGVRERLLMAQIPIADAQRLLPVTNDYSLEPMPIAQSLSYQAYPYISRGPFSRSLPSI
jgi:hypothetical protein